LSFTPIEKWLEIEGRRYAALPPSLVQNGIRTFYFQEALGTLSEKVEFMFGVGPEWILRGRMACNERSRGEVVLDFTVLGPPRSTSLWLVPRTGPTIQLRGGHER